MNQLKVLNIIEILHNCHTKENEKDLPEYLLTNCDSIKTISQVVTDIIYDAKNVNSETRNIIIKLLMHFTKSSSHATEEIDHILINTLNKERTKLNIYSDKYGEDFFKSFDLNIARPFRWNNIYDTVNKKYALLLGKNIELGLIHLWHQNNLTKLNFAYTLPNKLLQNHNPENLLLLLTNLKNIYSESIQETGNKPNIDFKYIIAPSKRNILFELIFVLLDVKHNEENIKILDNILVDMFVCRQGVDMRFIHDLWMDKENTQLPTCVYILLFQHFKYLYEKPILCLVIDIIKQNAEYEYVLQQSRVTDIVKICVLDVKLCCNLFIMFNKLLTLSKYDTRIIKLFKYVKTYYLNFSICK